MKTLYIERSTGNARDGSWVCSLDLEGVGRIVVGTGPGSFAGIRAALAFARGYSLGRPCEVLGLPSACACAAQVLAALPAKEAASVAVVGDARRGMRWVALFEGHRLVREIFQVAADALAASVPPEARVVTPDPSRIGGELQDLFGARYLGASQPTDEGLRLFAEANPSVLTPEPLPIYLNPAVRD